MEKNLFLKLILILMMISSCNFAKSQIYYFDITPDVTTEMSSTAGSAYNIFPIDFNNDGTEEYDFRWDDWGTDWFMHFTFNDIDDQIALDGTTTNMYGGRFVKKLAYNDPINSTLTWGTSYPEPFIGESTLNSNFLDQGDKYIGLKFKLGNNVHYGWVLVNFQTYNSTRKLIIKSYAYNSVPNAPIAAGQISSNEIVINNQDKIAIYPNPAKDQITIQNSEFINNNYLIYNSIGQLVKQGKTETGIIEFKDLENGVYFLRINNIEGKDGGIHKIIKL